VLDRLRTLDEPTRFWLIVAAVAALVAIPLVVSGPGNDLDVANVFRSGRAIVRHLDYVPSRPPGAPVHEAIAGVGDLLGGPLLANLLTLGAAVALVWALHDLLVREGIGRPARWAVLILAANPWFVVAATSTADYVFALLFVVLAARAMRRGSPVAAGLLAALAMGSRVGSATLLAAVLVAELTGSSDAGSSDAGSSDAGSTDGRPEGRRTRGRRVAIAAAVAVPATLVLFVPSILEAGGLSFAQNDFSTSSPLVQLGRALAKDVLLIGLPTLLVALAALPATVAAIGRWSGSWLVRFSVTGLVLSQLLFVRFPWKMAHLLPTLLALVVLWAVALEDRPRVLATMVALQVLFAVVRIDVIQPDDAGQASGGRIRPGVTWGPVVTDWTCRREHADAYLGRQKEEVEVAWTCAAPFRD
jgi:hypothetical protein